VTLPDTVVTCPKQQGRRAALPRGLTKELRTIAGDLAKRFRHEFREDPQLRVRAARVLKSLLPPHARRGRPRDPTVTRALKMYGKFRREHPNERPRALWYRVADTMIPGFQGHTELEKRALVDDLRARAKSRRRIQPRTNSLRISRL
jgi:hypothetical protein